MSSPALRVTLDPSPRQWRSLLADGVGRRDGNALRFRQQLGLEATLPLVMTGHQLVVWHPGILAKFMAAGALAARAGARVAWVGVDQDSELATEVRYPVSDANGTLVTKVHRLRALIPGDVAGVSLPATPPGMLDENADLPESVRDGLRAVDRAWARHAGAPNAAAQALAALTELLAPVLPEATAFQATAMARTQLFGDIVTRMRHDARHCAELYNEAVAANPVAQMTPLRITADSVELPLWVLEAGKPRRRVFDTDLPGLPLDAMAPRALLMTGLLRWAGCDLFIHGTGGAVYDTITEHWLGEWLGVTLAPAVMATADLLLPLRPPGVTPRIAAEAHWKAHRAVHDPAILGDLAAARSKEALVERIAGRRAAGERPLDDYRAMHAVLAAYRERHAGEIAELKSHAINLTTALASTEIAEDRTWPFPLHAASSLALLQSAIDEQFA